MTDTCGILWSGDEFKDVSGCLKPNAHNDSHICKTDEGIFMEWEDDYDCTCGCWDDENDLRNVCKWYKEVENYEQK